MRDFGLAAAAQAPAKRKVINAGRGGLPWRERGRVNKNIIDNISLESDASRTVVTRRAYNSNPTVIFEKLDHIIIRVIIIFATVQSLLQLAS